MDYGVQLTTDEAYKEIGKLIGKRAALEKKIADAARTVVPVLLDAGRTHSAKPLQELFFELDALDQEMKEFVERDPSAAMAAIVRGISRERSA